MNKDILDSDNLGYYFNNKNQFYIVLNGLVKKQLNTIEGVYIEHKRNI